MKRKSEHSLSRRTHTTAGTRLFVRKGGAPGTAPSALASHLPFSLTLYYADSDSAVELHSAWNGLLLIESHFANARSEVKHTIA